MGIFNTEPQEQAPAAENIPQVEQTPVETPVEQQPANEQPQEQSEVTQVVEAPAAENPSLNCNDCNGQGLADSYTLCPTCKGTGKI